MDTAASAEDTAFAVAETALAGSAASIVSEKTAAVVVGEVLAGDNPGFVDNFAIAPMNAAAAGIAVVDIAAVATSAGRFVLAVGYQDAVDASAAGSGDTAVDSAGTAVEGNIVVVSGAMVAAGIVGIVGIELALVECLAEIADVAAVDTAAASAGFP